MILTQVPNIVIEADWFDFMPYDCDTEEEASMKGLSCQACEKQCTLSLNEFLIMSEECKNKVIAQED